MFARSCIINLAVKNGRTLKTSAGKWRSVKAAMCGVTARLESARVPEPTVSAAYLIAKTLEMTNVQMLEENRAGHQDLELTPDQEVRLDTFVQCRLSRMPVQYIMGDWDFRQLTLKMRPPVFIPRPETEELVGHVLKYLEETTTRSGDENNVIHGLEVGCGSGAICLSLLREFQGGSTGLQLRMLAVDQSRQACLLTEENWRESKMESQTSNSLKIVNTKIDLAEEDCGFHHMMAPQSLDFIVSNPPYVLRKDMNNLAEEIKVYEDLRALDGGKRGLDVIEPILVSADKFLKDDGGKLFLEVDPCHPYLVPQTIEEKRLNLKMTSVVNDHQGKERFLIVTKHS